MTCETWSRQRENTVEHDALRMWRKHTVVGVEKGQASLKSEGKGRVKVDVTGHLPQAVGSA